MLPLHYQKLAGIETIGKITIRDSTNIPYQSTCKASKIRRLYDIKDDSIILDIGSDGSLVCKVLAIEIWVIAS